MFAFLIFLFLREASDKFALEEHHREGLNKFAYLETGIHALLIGASVIYFIYLAFLLTTKVRWKLFNFFYYLIAVITIIVIAFFLIFEVFGYAPMIKIVLILGIGHVLLMLYSNFNRAKAISVK